MILNCVLTVHCSLCLQPPYSPTQSHSCIWIESHFDYSFIHYPFCGLSIAITKSQVPHPFCLVSGYSGMRGDFDSSPRRTYRKEGPCENKSSTHTQIPNIIIVEFHVAAGNIGRVAWVIKIEDNTLKIMYSSWKLHYGSNIFQ